MWWSRKKFRRRLEFRKNLPALMPPLWARFRAAGGLGASLIAVVFFATLTAMDAFPSHPLPYRLGQYVPSDIHARVAFDIPSEERLKEAIDLVTNTTPATFQFNTPLVAEIVVDIKSLPGKLSAATQPSDVDPNTVKQFDLFSDEALKAWKAATQPSPAAPFEKQINSMKAVLRGTTTVPSGDLKLAGREVYLVYPGGRDLLPAARLISLDYPDSIEQAALRAARGFDPSIRENVQAYLVKTLRHRALYAYDKDSTQKDIDSGIAAVKADPPKEHFREGDRLVPRSLRTGPKGKEVAGLTLPELELLHAEQRAYDAHERSGGAWQKLARIGGRWGILLLITAMMTLSVLRHQPNIISDHWRCASLTVLLLAMLAMAKALYFPLQWNGHVVILPMLLAVIVLATAYEQRLAFVMGAILSVLMVFQLRADFPLLLVLLSGMMAVVFQLREIRRRGRLIEVAAVSGAVIVLTICSVEMANSVPWSFIAADCAWAAGFTMLAGFLAQGILPAVERLFGVATSLTLLEWCDASKPLLKRLAMEAPGTYNHSLQIGTMCEAASEAISARGLLARVGAYYHDIGKINKPEYFVENQISIASPHAKLSPAMSLLIIIGHVKDGIELARRYKLPAVLREFITSHHGTTLLQYFYQAATDQRKAHMERAPDEVEFRYPGPKPRSKECAILMLADAAESSVRSMSEPTPGRIENQVHTMAMRRLMDGQLDECDLTLKEVHLIEQSLIRSLCGIHHSRVSYPTPAGKNPSAAERLAARAQAEKAASAAPASTPPATADHPVTTAQPNQNQPE